MTMMHGVCSDQRGHISLISMRCVAPRVSLGKKRNESASGLDDSECEEEKDVLVSSMART
jgi:hypothetical protein